MNLQTSASLVPTLAEPSLLSAPGQRLEASLGQRAAQASGDLAGLDRGESIQPLERHPPYHASNSNLKNEPENHIRPRASIGRTELDAALRRWWLAPLGLVCHGGGMVDTCPVRCAHSFHKEATSRTPDAKMPGESRSSPRAIQNYLSRISGPLLDRIGLHIEVPPVKFREITSERTGGSSAQIRARVVAARQRQQARFKDKPKITCNARMGRRELKSYCALDDATMELLKFAMTDLNLSARAYDRILKVARTIADLAGAENITSEHISEAIQYRSLDRQLWT